MKQGCFTEKSGVVKQGMRRIALVLSLILLPLTAHAAEFKGSPCTKDCSGHKAGYAWAQKKAVTKPEDCKGRSESFVKGCRIYVAEQSKKKLK